MVIFNDVVGIIAATLFHLESSSLQQTMLSTTFSPQGQGPERPHGAAEVVINRHVSQQFMLTYGNSPGAVIRGWAARGGLYVLIASTVEVEFLGYNRSEKVPLYGGC